jgi:outer membrane protein OmpA-like peptidoglycan-associated protein
MTWLVWALLAADAVTINTKTRVYAHEGVPSLTIIVRQAIEGATLTLAREDLKKFDFKIPKTAKGEYTFKLAQDPGTSLDYEGELEVRFKGHEVSTVPLHFKGEVIVPLEITTTASAKDVAARHFTVHCGRDLVSVEMALTGEDGVPLGKQVFKPKTPSSDFQVEWTPTRVPVVRIDAVFADAHNVTRNMQLFPWYVEVQHEDVGFASNQFDIPKSEESKLQAAGERILAAAKKAIDHAPVKLYVLGHTDTVGPNDKNLALSHKRARAIAQWFKKHGFTPPIFAVGLGETALAVPTPDETDKAENRRAQYVLTVDPPDVGKELHWDRI